VTQFARPVSDLAANVSGNWTGTYAAVDEVTLNTSDFINGVEGATSGINYKSMHLSAVTNPGTLSPNFAKLRVSARWPTGGAGSSSGAFTIFLLNGGGTYTDTLPFDSVVASFLWSPTVEYPADQHGWHTYELWLGDSEAAGITSWGNLDVAVSIPASTGAQFDFAWIEFEVPDPSSPPAFSEGCNPDEGPELGGTEVTLYRGAGGLTTTKSITFDGRPAMKVTVVDDNTVTCLSPAHPVDTVDVIALNAAGATLATYVDAFTYTLFAGYSFPTITSISPNTDTILGGTLVTITGTGFIPGMQVYFDELLADNITYVSSTTYTCRVPPHELGIAKVSMRQP